MTSHSCARPMNEETCTFRKLPAPELNHRLLTDMSLHIGEDLAYRHRARPMAADVRGAYGSRRSLRGAHQ